MDQAIYSEVVKLRAAIFSNPKYGSKFKGFLKKYKNFQKGFPSDLSPSVAFASLLGEAKSSGSKTLELRMRAMLDRVGSKAGGSYNPQKSDFPAASPGVLVWMANKLLAQNSTEDAVAAMERLVNVYGDTGGNFSLMPTTCWDRLSRKNEAISLQYPIMKPPWQILLGMMMLTMREFDWENLFLKSGSPQRIQVYLIVQSLLLRKFVVIRIPVSNKGRNHLT
jgi:hypothetical protein